MQPDPNPHVLLAISLLLWCSGIVRADSRVQFNQEASSCPSGDLQALLADGSLRQLTGVQDRRSCLIECSLWQQCVSVRHSPASASCQLGSLKAWMQAWQAAGTDNCTSYTRPPPLPETLQPKLLIFYNFRFGLANQVNSSAFPVAPGSAQRSKLGLQFMGDFTNKVEIDLMGRGLNDYLSPPRQVTFFIKVSSTYDFTNACFHLAYNKTISSADGVSGKWCRGGGNHATFFARSLTPSTYTSSGAFLPSDSVTQLTYSTAVSYSATTGVRFFYNGTVDSVAPTVAENLGQAGDTGLIIGYDIYAPFKGYVICYGVAAAALTLDEVQKLDGLC